MNFSPEQLSNELIRHGFENVSVKIENSTLIIGYENRRYRFEPAGMARLIEIVDKFVDQGTTVRLILHFQQVPMIIAEFPIEVYRLLKNQSIDQTEFSSFLNIHSNVTQGSSENDEVRNSSLYKADIAVIPHVRTQFGDFDRPVQANFNLIPELNIQLTKGLSIKSQVLIPVFNNFLIQEQAETRIRPGINTLNFLTRLEDNFFIRVSGGFFNRERVGLDSEIKKYFGKNRWAIGINAGYTGYHSFTPKISEYFEEDTYLTALISVEYFYQPYDLTMRVLAGNFLYNDLAIRADILRQFGEVNIGFFTTMNNRSQWNGGFNFSIPLPPRKHLKINYIRLRQADSFKWEYRARGFTSDARFVSTGLEIYDVMQEYNPEFFKKRLIIEILN